MELGLQDKVALVTGASRGIGRAIAEALAFEGCHVAVAARSTERLQDLARDLEARRNRGMLAIPADLRTAEAPTAITDAVARRFGRLDILVNSAGATKRGDFLALSDADWQDGYALKLFGTVRMVRACWPLLKAAGGTVITIAGVGGRTPGAEFTIGGSVNAALLSFTKAMAEQGIRDGVRVNAVNPGPVATDRLKNRIRSLAAAENLTEAAAAERLCQNMGIARFGEPADIAALVIFLAGSRAAFLQGALIDIDGGQTRTL